MGRAHAERRLHALRAQAAPGRCSTRAPGAGRPPPRRLQERQPPPAQLVGGGLDRRRLDLDSWGLGARFRPGLPTGLAAAPAAAALAAALAARAAARAALAAARDAAGTAPRDRVVHEPGGHLGARERAVVVDQADVVAVPRGPAELVGRGGHLGVGVWRVGVVVRVEHR